MEKQRVTNGLIREYGLVHEKARREHSAIGPQDSSELAEVMSEIGREQVRKNRLQDDPIDRPCLFGNLALG
jgi:hypothetical protein